MASGDLIAFAHPKDLSPQDGLAYEVPLSPVAVPSSTGGAATGLLGVPLPKDAVHAYQFEGRVPLNGTPLTTGLTLNIGLIDDPMNPGAGLVIRVGVSFKRIVSGTTDYSTTGFGTEVLASVTMPATSGVGKATAVAVANANLTSLAAGDRFIASVRRVGTDALDTHPGVVLMTGISVSDT